MRRRNILVPPRRSSGMRCIRLPRRNNFKKKGWLREITTTDGAELGACYYGPSPGGTLGAEKRNAHLRSDSFTFNSAHATPAAECSKINIRP